MNVRNFSDLDDILIDASENDDNYQNSGYEYDEDFEQEESPAKDQAKLQRQARSNFDDTNFGGDNHDEDYTLDQGEQQATFTEFEAVIDLKEIVDPNEDQDELTSDNASPKLLDAPEKKLDVLIEINVPSPDDKMNSFELQGEIEAVTENTFVNQLNRSNVPPRPNVITSRNEYIGNKNQFSHVRKVSDDDGTFILNQQKKKINNGISGSGTDSCKGKEENVHTLQEMIEIAAEKISIKNIAMSSLASRAIPVPAIQLGISNGHNRDLFGISYYNPDYDSAVEMMQKKLIHNPSLTHEGYNSTHARSSSYRGSNDNPYDNDQQNLNRNSDSRKTFTNNDHTALLKDKSFTPNRQTTTLESHRGEETVISLIEEINTEKENLQLLRLGVDRNMLCNKSEEIHSSFLRDLIELCRARSAGSTSIEELAMHRALTDHVREKFLLPGVIKTTRASMVSTAVEASLKYVPIKSENIPEFTRNEGRNSDNIVNAKSNINSEKKLITKQRKKLPKGTAKIKS